MKNNSLKIIKTSNIESLPGAHTNKNKSSIFGELKSDTDSSFGEVFGGKSE